ncbi:MAG: peroxiredoxin-like family protein [Planctomycetota bacterium]|nr:peroxiredoxin-like family protein [Planctomycetota bacterium]
MKAATLCVIAMMGLAGIATAQQPPAAEQVSATGVIRNTAAWNLASKTRLAISGYDPVSYFPQGGSKPLKGDSKYEVFHMGARYWFANVANRDAFLKDTSKYEPSHGGWCSWAMREGDKVEVDPTSFIVKDGRLFLFYKGFLADTRSKWLALDHATELGKADANWLKLSGEQAPKAVVLAPVLAPVLASVWEKAAERMGAETAAGYAKGIETLKSMEIEKRAMKTGDAAPAFELADSGGTLRSLEAMRAQGPVVVMFVRGSWCPFCNVQMQAYQQMLPELKSLGASIIAITPQMPERSAEMVSKGGIEFPVLFDRGNEVAKRYGISFTNTSGMDLSKINGDSSGALPVPATYVIGRDGKIDYSFVNADYRLRAEPADILEAVRAASSASTQSKELVK